MLLISWTSLLFLHDGDHLGPDGFRGGGRPEKEKSERMSLVLGLFNDSFIFLVEVDS